MQHSIPPPPPDERDRTYIRRINEQGKPKICRHADYS